MRRDLLVTALIFLVLGFVGGYIFSEQTHGPGRGAPGPATSTAASTSLEDPTLPEGHPPMDVAARWQELKQTAESNPRDARAAVEFANFLFDLERWDDAIFWYRRSLELDSTNGDARTDLATSYYNLSRFDEAAREYNRALELEANKPEALYGLAMVRLRGKQDVAGARRLYERLRRSHPAFPGLEPLARLLAEEQPR